MTFSSDITISGSIDPQDRSATLYPPQSYYGPFINQGTIEENGGELTIDAATWVNDGTITATGATLNLDGNWTNNGSITATPPRRSASDRHRHRSDLTGRRHLRLDESGHHHDRGRRNRQCGRRLHHRRIRRQLRGSRRDGGPRRRYGLSDRNDGQRQSGGSNPNTQGKLALGAATGPLYLSGGEIYEGQVTTVGGDNLIATYPGGTLDGVTLNGTLDMSQGSATITIVGGTLNGVLNLLRRRPAGTILGGLTLNADVYLSGGGTFLYFNDTNPQAVSAGALVGSAPSI